MDAKDVAETKRKRLAYLVNVYDRSQGSTSRFVSGKDVGRDLGLSEFEVDNISTYLEDDGLLQHKGDGPVDCITHAGIKVAEQAIEHNHVGK